MTPVAFYLILAGLCFLYVLNLYLRGSSRALLEVALALMIIGANIAAFFILGWRLGLVTVLITFPLTWILRPLARRTARRILGYQTGIQPADSSLESGRSFEQVVAAHAREHESNRDRLTQLARRPAIRAILKTLDVSLEDFASLHDDLAACGLESDLKWETLSNPAHLRAVIKMKREGKTPAEVAWEVRQL